MTPIDMMDTRSLSTCHDIYIYIYIYIYVGIHIGGETPLAPEANASCRMSYDVVKQRIT